MSVTVNINPLVDKRIDPTVVRKALPGEYESIMMLCRQLHRENGIFSLNEEKVARIIEAALTTDERRQRGILGVIGHINELDGMMLLQVSQYYYSDDYFLEEMFSFVPPRARKSHNGKKLLQWAIKMQETLAIPLMIGIVSTHRTEAKVRLYRRSLGVEAGAFFLHGINPEPKMTNGSAMEH